MATNARFFTPKQIDVLKRQFVPKQSANLALSITWDTKHPDWPGSFIAFWSKKIHEGLTAFPLGHSHTDAVVKLSPLAQRLANDPNAEVKLIAWLRDTWSGPQSFVMRMPGGTQSLPSLAQLAAFTWNADRTRQIAMAAAALYLYQVCRTAASNVEYDPRIGECKRQ